MKKIVVRKSDNRIVGFGTEDTSRFSSAKFDVIRVDITELPDELRFCIYDYVNEEAIVDEIYKQQILAEEAETQQTIQKARRYIKDNNPENANSVPKLRERVKRLEVLLGIYKWL